MVTHYKSVFIGTVAACRSAAHAHGTADIGLIIGASVHGKGALATLMKCLLDTGTCKVTCATLCCNVVMARILEGCGIHPVSVNAG